MEKYFIILTAFLFSCSAKTDKNLMTLLPQPQIFEITSDTLVLQSSGISINNFNKLAAGELIVLDEIDLILKKKYKTYLSNDTASVYLKLNTLSLEEANKVKLKDRRAKERFLQEGYVLEISKNGIDISAVSDAGLFYGLQSLKQLLQTNTYNAKMPGVKIIDYPEFQFRALMDDISRGPIPNIEFMKLQIRRLAELKYNYLTYYIEHVVKTKSHPEFAPDDALTIDEIKELSAYAKSYYITLIGNFQSFGHFEHILSHPKYAPLGERGKLLTPAKEESYEFLSDIYSELIPAFDSPMFIVNCDETFDLGKGYSKSMVDSLGYAEVYRMHIMRLYDIVKSYGKQMVIWGDVILNHPELLDELPKDIIVGTWDYSAHVNIKELVDPILGKGFPTLVVPGVLNSRRLFPDYDVALSNINFVHKVKAIENLLGGMLTIWDDGGFALFNHDWYGTAYAAQSFWNKVDRGLEEFDNIYNNNILQSKNNNFSSAIHEINKLSDLIPTYIMNDKVLKTQLINNDKNEIILNSTEWDSVYSISHKVNSLLAEVGNVKYPEEIEALRLVNNLYEVLAEEKIKLKNILGEKKHLNEAQFSNAIIDYSDSITNKYQKLLNELNKLWRFENREHFLADVKQMIQKRIDNISLIPNLMIQPNNKINIFDGKYFSEWLSPMPIPVRSFSEAQKNLLSNDIDEEKFHPKITQEFNIYGNTYRWSRISSKVEDINEVVSESFPFTDYFYATISNKTVKNVDIELTSESRVKIILNNVVIYDDFSLREVPYIKSIKKVTLLDRKNTLMIKTFSNKKILKFLFKINDLRISGRKNKYEVLE